MNQNLCHQKLKILQSHTLMLDGEKKGTHTFVTGIAMETFIMHQALGNFRLLLHHVHGRATQTRISWKQVSIFNTLSIFNADLDSCQRERRSICEAAVCQSPTQRVLMCADMRDKVCWARDGPVRGFAPKKETVGWLRPSQAKHCPTPHLQSLIVLVQQNFFKGLFCLPSPWY